jgi:hypothetical protein
MSYEEKANANREVADTCMMGGKDRECVAASRYYYAALLFAKGYLHSYGDDPEQASHTTKNIDGTIQFSIWKLVRNTLDDGDYRLKVLRDFEFSYKKLRVQADYEATYLNKVTLVKLRNDVSFLFKELKYYGKD